MATSGLDEKCLDRTAEARDMLKDSMIDVWLEKCQ